MLTERGRKSLNGLKFGIFIIRFPSDGARGKYGNQKVNFAVSTRLTVQLPLASYARPLVRGEQNCYLWGSERTHLYEHPRVKKLFLTNV